MTRTDLQAEIALANQAFMQTFASGDAVGLAELYTSDGALLPTGSEMLAGVEAIQAFWQGALDAGLAQATLATKELEAHGDTAIEIGRYELGDAEGNVADTGKYLVVWKKDGGQWKLHRDIWNTNQPAQ